LTEKHTTFIEQWERLISLESEEILKATADAWATTQLERENVGKCLPRMKVAEEKIQTSPLRYLYKSVVETIIHHQNFFFKKKKT